MIIVFDTNIWVSALGFDGLPERAILRAALFNELAISAYIEDEIVRILTAKFIKNPLWLRARLDGMLKRALVVEVTGEIRGVCRDPKDDAILETAWRANADYLVTGDKDLLSLKEFRGTKIITVAAYLGIA